MWGTSAWRMTYQSPYAPTVVPPQPKPSLTNTSKCSWDQDGFNPRPLRTVSPSSWWMRRNEGTKQRPTVDYCRLNAKTISEDFPLPRNLWNRRWTFERKVFTTLDLPSWFRHVTIAQIQNICCHNGSTVWMECLHMGLKNSPIVFHRILANVLRKHGLASFTSVCIDDVLIFSKNFKASRESARS